MESHMKRTTNKFFQFNYLDKELIIPFSFQLESLISLIVCYYENYSKAEKVKHIRLIKLITDLGLKDAYCIFSALYEIEGSWKLFEDSQYVFNDNNGKCFYFPLETTAISIHDCIRTYTGNEPYANKRTLIALVQFHGFTKEEAVAIVEDAIR